MLVEGVGPALSLLDVAARWDGTVAAWDGNDSGPTVPAQKLGRVVHFLLNLVVGKMGHSLFLVLTSTHNFVLKDGRLVFVQFDHLGKVVERARLVV